MILIFISNQLFLLMNSCNLEYVLCVFLVVWISNQTALNLVCILSIRWAESHLKRLFILFLFYRLGGQNLTWDGTNSRLSFIDYVGGLNLTSDGLNFVCIFYQLGGQNLTLDGLNLICYSIHISSFYILLKIWKFLLQKF